MGLKLEGRLKESYDLLIASLNDGFGITPEALFSSGTREFEGLLNEQNFSAEKLEMLSQFLYSEFDPFVKDIRNDSFAEKLILIYEALESKYHIVNMINLDRQKVVREYLNN